MSSLLNSTTLVVSFFIDWLSSLTTALISNPVVQIIFALGIISLIISFIISILLRRKNRKNSRVVGDFTFEDIDQYELDEWDRRSFL